MCYKTDAPSSTSSSFSSSSDASNACSGGLGIFTVLFTMSVKSVSKILKASQINLELYNQKFSFEGFTLRVVTSLYLQTKAHAKTGVCWAPSCNILSFELKLMY